MLLTQFISQLLNDGTVTVDDTAIVFGDADDAAATERLRSFYKEDSLELPGTAPVFNEAAALWAAKYVYAAVHFTVLREETEAAINSRLTGYPNVITASVIYSADLVLRHLPALLQLAAGLAPADILVKTISAELEKWPLSAPENTPADSKVEAVILADPSLKIMYLDRLIITKNNERITAAGLQQQLTAVAGAHLETFWPGASLTFKKPIE